MLPTVHSLFQITGAAGSHVLILSEGGPTVSDFEDTRTGSKQKQKTYEAKVDGCEGKDAQGG